MRPTIGITCSLSVSVADSSGGRVYENNVLGLDYTRAVEQAGGFPVILPTLAVGESMHEYFERIDGLLLSGGIDMDPLLYGEEPHLQMGGIDVLRDQLEMALTRGSVERSLPIFAICRGIQVLNVALGGTLYQDISQHDSPILKHRQNSPKWHGSHTVDIVPHTLLSTIIGQTEWRVNSFHHQAVKQVAPGFRASAHSKDGIIEAIESIEQPFVLGVQFHPEMMWEKEPAAMNLFKTFVEACRVT